MNKLRIGAAWLLALPLLVFGANNFLGFFPLPEGDGSAGDQLLQSMHSGGLMTWIALSHVVIGVLLIVPRTRFAGAVLQLPLSLGILAFHGTMLPAGLGPAIFMLVLNLVLVADAKRVRSLLG